MRKNINYIYLVLFGLLGSGCNSDTSNSVNDMDFGNPVEVSIVGYDGDAQEPHISKDGNILFFNNLNSENLPGGDENDTDIHYASRIDDYNFTYIAKVAGANTDDISGINELEAVASMDKNGTFYFVNTSEYLDASSQNYLRSLYQADYVSGQLLNIQSIPNLKNDRPANQAPILGELNFDGEVHSDGEVLYFVEGIFSGNPFPDEADIGIAVRVDGVFTVSSADEFDLINTANLEYAPSISTDQLELYFTRATSLAGGDYDFGIYMATRNSVLDSWGNVKRLAISDAEFSEAPSISYDGKFLYYHQKSSGVFKVYVSERK